jgi:hypothetical protein
MPSLLGDLETGTIVEERKYLKVKNGHSVVIN